MSHYIVLVKQVPDVSQITHNAFDPVTGNLIRTRLPSVINELDAQALAFAHRMRQLAGDDQVKAANPSNCLHCKTCQRKCPYDNIRWTAPEPTGGPKYKTM